MLTKNVGTCTGKHKLLESALQHFDIPYECVVCTFRWENQGLKLPAHLQALLDQGSWSHGHNWVRIHTHTHTHTHTHQEPIDVDLTWDSALAPYGFAVLPDNWDGQSSFIGLQTYEQRWNGVSIDQMKEQLIATLTPDQRHRREQFVEGLINWSNQIHQDNH